MGLSTNGVYDMSKGHEQLGKMRKSLCLGGIFFFNKTIFHMLITYCFSRDVSIGVAWRHAIYAELAGVWLL